MTRRTAPAHTRRPWRGAVAAAVLLPALLAGCGAEDGPGSAPDLEGDRAPDPARVQTPAPLIDEAPDPTIELPGPSASPNTAGGPEEGGETSGEAQGEENADEEGTGANG